jgi:hypothetical protein
MGKISDLRGQDRRKARGVGGQPIGVILPCLGYEIETQQQKLFQDLSCQAIHYTTKPL